MPACAVLPARAADTTREAIVDGTLHPFTGPIRNQKGEIAVPEGETIDDETLQKMDWYVEGVEA